MRIALVTMPWMPFTSPSYALGTLAAYLRAARPDIAVSCRNEHVTVWSRLGETYDSISAIPWLGELPYIGVHYPERQAEVRLAALEYVEQVVSGPEWTRDRPIFDGTIFDDVVALLSGHV